MLRSGDKTLEQVLRVISCVSPVISLQGTGAGLWVPRMWSLWGSDLKADN